MKLAIRDVVADDLEIPYEAEYRPAWQPGLVRKTREFTLVRVYTEEGIVGYGGTDGFHARTIERDVKPYLVGRDVFELEKHARVLRNAGGMWFVDLALWDIIGKAVGLPLYRLWGSYRDTVMAYASTAQVGTPEERAQLALRYRDEGFRAMKLRFHCETIAEDLAILEKVRDAVGSDFTLMVDANQATTLPSPQPGPVWDYQRALTVARELENYGVLWLEEPLPRYDFDNLIRLRENTNIYIAGGEKNRGLHEFRWLIERGVYDIIQPDVTMSEGLTQVRKIAALAEVYRRHFVPHHGLSALGLAATVHLACSVPFSMMWLEMMYEPPVRTIEGYQCLGGIIETPIWIDKDGYVRPPEKPGLGVEVNESKIARYAVR